MTQQTGDMPRREQIARIIDPGAFAETLSGVVDDLEGFYANNRARALAKADAIEALSCVGEEEVERVGVGRCPT